VADILTKSDSTLLLVCNFFPPQNNIAVRRMASFATGIKLGSVTVLTTKKDPRYDGNLDSQTSVHTDDHPVTVVELPYVKQKPSTDRPTKNLPKPTNNINSSSFIQKIKSIVSPDLLDRRFPFLFKGIIWLRNWQHQGEKPKFVLSSSPLFINHFIGFFASRLFKAKWVVDYRDLWTLDPFRTGRGPFAVAERLLERCVVSKADLILAVSEGQKSALRSLFPEKRIEVIFNGVDAQVINSLKSSESYVRSGSLKIIYLGTVIPGKRDVEPLFAALKDLRLTKSLPDLQFEFYGTTHDEVSRLIDKYDLKGIARSFAQISTAKALEQYSKADVLLFLDWMDPRVPGVLTGKLFEYIASGAEILSLTGDPASEANALIKRHQAGSVVLNEKEAIKSYLSSLPTRIDKLREPRKVRSSADEFRREVLAQKLTDLMANLL
jgi:hypothetical protein